MHLPLSTLGGAATGREYSYEATIVVQVAPLFAIWVIRR